MDSDGDLHKNLNNLMDPLAQTFPTEIDFANSDEFPANSSVESLSDRIPKLPQAVNFVAIRESLLSEAPFVSSKNKYFWRRCVNSRFFQNILSSAFHFISDCIVENNAFDMGKLNSIDQRSHLTTYMSTNLAEMFFSMKLRDRDVFLARLPEVIGFMLVNALLTSLPKHHKLFNALKFREILLDWCSEVLCGIRFSNMHTDREWYFSDHTEAQITLINTEKSTKKRSKSLARRRTSEGVTVSKVSVELSPLIHMYVSSLKRVENPLKVSLSQLPDRPLTTLGNYVPKYSRTRPKLIDDRTVKLISRDSGEKRHHIMEQFRTTGNENEKDLKTMRLKLRSDIQQMTTDFTHSIDIAKKSSKLKKEEWKASLKYMSNTDPTTQTVSSGSR